MKYGGLCVILLVLLGCSTDPVVLQWRQFHADSANRGFQDIQSGYALVSAWVSAPHKVTCSSPVIGYDGLGREAAVYIGTANGRLLAIDADDGRVSWQHPPATELQDVRIFSSPAVSDSGDIFIIANHRTAEGWFQSRLHKFNRKGRPIGSYGLPDHGFTTSCPKILTIEDRTVVFIQATVFAQDHLRTAFFAIEDSPVGLELIAQHNLGACGATVRYGTCFMKAMQANEAVWNTFSRFPLDPVGTTGEASSLFLDPTPALVVEKGKVVIAAVDNFCNVGVFEWDGRRFTSLWSAPHPFLRHSSPLVAPNGLMIYGDSEGMVLAHDIRTGVVVWEYDAGEAVLATPTSLPSNLMAIVSQKHIHILKGTDGSVAGADSSPLKLEVGGVNRSSPAATAERIYITGREMLTVSLDLKTRGYDSNFVGNGLSSPAVDSQGSVYAVDWAGALHKYRGIH
jgi:outer membrane protein assembly factor BamB